MRSTSFFISLALLVLPAAAQECKRSFSAPDRIVTTGDATSAAYGDFDEDGQVDVAFTSLYRLAVSVNRGEGVFEPVSSENLPQPYSSARIDGVTDLDRDGHLDLLFGYLGAPVNAWARGRGNGTFANLVALRLYDGSFSGHRLIDFDNDGFLDVAIWREDEVHFFRAAENGTFAAVSSSSWPSLYLENESVTVGDFDGDGNVDAVRMAYDFLPGKYVASFVWSATTPTPVKKELVLPFAPREPLEPVDLDGDGSEELLGASADAIVAFHLANRELTQETLPFPSQLSRASLGSPHPMAVDIDGDGRRDLLFSYRNSAAVARGIDGGRFAEPVLLGAGGANDFTLADIDGDGTRDIVTTTGREGLHVVYAGSAATESPSQRLFPLSFSPRRLQLADINRDGLDDVVAAGADLNRVGVSVLLNDGTGSFRVASTQDRLGSSVAVAVADFDGDGHFDLAEGPITTYEVVNPVVVFGDSTGLFSGKVDLSPGRVMGSLRTSAGAAVLVIQNGEVRALRITRAGEATATTLLPHTEDAVVRAFDLDGDGIDEIAVGTPSGIAIFEGTGSTWTKVHTLTPLRSWLETIVATDVNGDQVDDLFATGVEDAAIYIRNGSSYDLAQAVNSWGFLGDVDGDRHPDLIRSSGRFALQVLRNDGLGEFTTYNTCLSIGGHPAVVTDVDGDGAADLLLAGSGGVAMQRNVCITPRVRVAAVPRRVTPGNPVKLVVHALSTDSFAIGTVTIKWKGAVVARDQPGKAYDYATTVWTSAPLQEGRHVFVIEYVDQFAGPSSTTLTLDVADAPPRRRTVRH